MTNAQRNNRVFNFNYAILKLYETMLQKGEFHFNNHEPQATNSWEYPGPVMFHVFSNDKRNQTDINEKVRGFEVFK